METKKRKKGNTSRATGRFRSEAALDAELGRLLDKALNQSTKRELAADEAFEALATQEQAVGFESYTSGENGHQFEMNPTEELASARGAEEAAAMVLASLLFRDGGSFEFRGRPSDGEIGMAYRGENDWRWLTATGDVVSPLRIFCSLAPPDAPVPWLLAAADRQPDRAALVGGRSLCDTLPQQVPVQDDLVRLQLPGAAGGWWVPDSLGVGFFCGINGESEFDTNVCQWMAAHHPPSTSIFPNIYKCTSTLSVSLTHNSTSGGKWRRRKCSTGMVAACGGKTRIVHQYRKLSFFSWKWVDGNEDAVGPSNWVGTLYMGLVRRRRRIVYKNEDDIGGFRAWSKFSQHLTDY